MDTVTATWAFEVGDTVYYSENYPHGMPASAHDSGVIITKTWGRMLDNSDALYTVEWEDGSEPDEYEGWQLVKINK